MSSWHTCQSFKAPPTKRFMKAVYCPIHYSLFLLGRIKKKESENIINEMFK